MSLNGSSKTASLPSHAEAEEVASDFPSVNCQLPSTEGKSLAASVTSVHGSASPLSKRERRGREGAINQPPSPPSLTTLPKPKPKQIALAAYAGAVSRFCDLHGLTPDASAGDKASLEFDAFNRYLSDLDAERRRVAQLNF